MNREIKFRVWHKIRERYYDVEMIDFVREEVSYIFDNHIQQIRYWVNFEDSVIEQYTVLKDKNGVEIFEGDIIKVTDEVYHYCFDEVLNNVYFREVKKTGSRFDFGFGKGYIREYYTTFEVVGNIHENKELLK